ncbi:ABC transporter permease [Streptomyces armeniacus]|uniref:ABC transporter permease n=1 Tax=Streptomyces armeniacus TaxID=83291 RepID=A0A345XNZ9_9ACTN|nr:ABC transporter permease [Streptomyces armeniacus]AXK33365.1 ABC transporter permease [Streptomyces armeniacus]
MNPPITAAGSGSATASGPADVPLDDRATFADAVHSEWTKLRTLRSSTYTLLSAVVLGVAMAFFFTSGTGEGYAGSSASEKEEWDPTLTSLLGATLFAQLAIGALGVLSSSGEYATGMIRTSLTVVPRRGRLMAAKAVVIGGVALVAGELIGFAGFLISQPVLKGMDVPYATLGQPHVLRAVIGTGLYLSMVALLGLALGLLVRSTAGAIILLVVATVIIPYMVGPMLPPLARGAWPVMSGMMIMSTNIELGIPAWAAFGMMAAGVGAVLAAAYVLFRRRDV